jgi:hypothetical protein
MTEIAVPCVFEIVVTDADLAVFSHEHMTMLGCPTPWCK